MQGKVTVILFYTKLVETSVCSKFKSDKHFSPSSDVSKVREVVLVLFKHPFIPVDCVHVCVQERGTRVAMEQRGKEGEGGGGGEERERERERERDYEFSVIFDS